VSAPNQIGTRYGYMPDWLGIRASTRNRSDRRQKRGERLTSPLRTGPQFMPDTTHRPLIGQSVLKDSGAAVELLSLLSNRCRLTILYMLTLQGEMQPREISRRIGSSQSATSQHLAKLLTTDLVQCRRMARSKYYRMSDHARAMHIDVFVRLVIELM